MLAVIKTGGKQYKAEVGQHLVVEKIDAKKGESFEIKEVLLLSDEKGTTVGEPIIANAVVKAKVVDHVRGDKIIVFKKKRRQNYRRKKGHKQELSKIEITEIKSK